MKKTIKVIVYIGVLAFLVACEQPFFHYSNLHSAVMEQGDSLFVHLGGMGGIHYDVFSHDSICTVVPTNKDGSEATIYALRPGRDTIDIYGVTAGGSSAWSPSQRIHILVIEKDTTTYN